MGTANAQVCQQEEFYFIFKTNEREEL